jgi:hypothetical protein
MKASRAFVLALPLLASLLCVAGALVPQLVPAEELERMDRFVRELTSHLERAIATESHATAKIIRPTEPRLPWTSSKPTGS